MQYTPHYNLNLPEGTDIVNPLIQDNPNYSAIDTALYANKLRVVGTATHTKTGTNHSIVLADSDIPVFRFVATGDYAVGDTFSVDGVTVTPRIADGSSIPAGAFKINSTVEAILDGTVLNLINVEGAKLASGVYYNNSASGLSSSNAQGAIDEIQNEIASFTPGYYFGTYISFSDSTFGIFVPFDVQHKGVPTPSIIDLNYVGTYDNGVTVSQYHDNAIIVRSTDLVQSANYIGRLASVYLKS